MLCKSCHYPLKQLSEPRCPECGLAFDPNDPNTFEVPRPKRTKFWFLWVFIGVIVMGATGMTGASPCAGLVIVAVAYGVTELWRDINSP